MLRRDRLSAFPRLRRAGFSSGMRQLDTGNASLPLDKGEHSPQRFDVAVAPDAQILGTDPAIRCNCGGLGEDGRGSSYSPTPEVHQMPVSRDPVYAGILAHGGDEDSMRQFQAAEAEGIE